MTAAEPASHAAPALRNEIPETVRALRIGLTYWWRHGHWPSLHRPGLFSEWVQWRKLHDRSPALAALTDKLHSKTVATNLIGGDLVMPTLWSGTVLPTAPPGPLPLMVKANHGCGQFAIVRNDEDWRLARKASAEWLVREYGRWLDEWHYRAARRCCWSSRSGATRINFR